MPVTQPFHSLGRALLCLGALISPPLSAQDVAADGATVPALVDHSADDQAADEWTTQILPVLQERCFRCHGDKKQKGDIRLDTLDPAMPTRADAEGFHTALDMLDSGEMPPEDEPQLTDDERRRVSRWLRTALAAAADRQKGERSTVLRRLTREQYSTTVQELLGVPIDVTRALPEDGKAKNGYSNHGEVLQSSPLHLETFEQLARQVLAQAIVVGDQPAITRYRVSFGQGIGKGHVAAETGGYQSVPLSPDDFTVDLLGSAAPSDPAAREQLQRRITVGLRGSEQDRFQVVDNGIVLLSALPHREVTPASWQGPSPNLKLEMQRCWPEQGDFVMRVRASRGVLPPLRQDLLLRLDEPVAQCRIDADGSLQTNEHAIVLPAERSDQRQNLQLDGEQLLPIEVPKEAKARLAVDLPRDGYYQVDLVHAPRPKDGMPSARLRGAGHHLDQRLEPTAEQLTAARVVTPLGVMGMRKGRRHFELGGPFFVGFAAAVVTPLGEQHPLVQRLREQHLANDAGLAALVPSMRAFVGTRTDDGMDYLTFGEPQEVHAAPGEFADYSFFGRLENLPIPEPESGDTEILSGFLLLGLWNDHLVKSPKETGPPLLIESIEFEAPYLPVWPPASHRELFGDGPERATDDVDGTRRLLARFLPRAFRRPVTADEIERYVGFWRQLRADFASYEESIRELLVAVLCSPEFLFLCEPPTGPGDDALLPDWALQNRLSYFLWNGPPDDELQRLAAASALRPQLLRQVDRLLDDPRAERFVRRFTTEWLRLDRHAGISIDVDRHRDYTRFVKRDMAREAIAFVGHVLREDLPVTTFVAADFAMLNQNLAEFYGVTGPNGSKVMGDAMRAVAVSDPVRRGGLMSLGAVLAGHSDGREPHPIKRAVWLKGRLLNDPPPPPPPNVPELDQNAPGAERLTLKQQLEQHRDKASCRDCHAGIDPFGIPFERLSAVGRFEPKRKGIDIDDSSTLPDGTAVDGLPALRRYLLDTHHDALLRATLEHLLAYALGRELQFGDRPAVAAMLQQAKIGGGRLRSVIRAIVASPEFQSK